MKVSRMTILVLSTLFYFLTEAGEGLAAEVNPAGAAKSRKSLHPSHRDKEVGEGRKQSSPTLWKAAGEVQLGDGADDKAAGNLQLGTSKQKPSSKRPFLPLSPPKGKSQGLETHLEGHGNFNTDMYSCPGIQLKACRKPSDCDGCLGLYTCKLPKGRCDLKAVSRQTEPDLTQCTVKKQMNWGFKCCLQERDNRGRCKGKMQNLSLGTTKEEKKGKLKGKRFRNSMPSRFSGLSKLPVASSGVSRKDKMYGLSEKLIQNISMYIGMEMNYLDHENC